MTIYQRIKDICADKGISVSSIEKKANLANGLISKWEVSEPSALKLKAVADALEVPIEELIPKT